jgi:tetratricopeptide (TPR) repeat protein
MGKNGSKLTNVASFDHVKSVAKSNDVRKKNIPIDSIDQSPQAEKRLSVADGKSSPVLVENMILVWLDISSEKQTDANQKILNQFQHVINLVQTFTDIEKCYEFVYSIHNEKILFVVSGSWGPLILPRIDDFDQIYSVYIFCGNKANHVKWIEPFKKIRGVHTQIKDLCNALRYDYNQYDKSLTAVSILPPSPISDLNQSNKQFLYLQMMKSILLEIQYDKKFRGELIEYSRKYYCTNVVQLNMIDTFDENYLVHSPIWWYTRKCFIYRMLRKAFYEQDFEIIYKLAFFIRDLHREIKKAYLQAHSHQYHAISVYRAAGMTGKEFENLEKNHNGLLSFNDFVTTTLERSIALRFAQKLRSESNVISVIYKLDIDPSKSSIPFIALNNLTYLSSTNGEILLSMNTIFHIDLIEKISDRIFEVSLSPVRKKDEQIVNLVNYMQEVTRGLTGWYKLSKMLMMVEEYDQVAHIYKYIYDQLPQTNRDERSSLLHELGYVYELNNDLPNAILHYEQAIEIHLPNDHPMLLSTYTNLAGVLRKQGDLNGALDQYRRALKLEKPNELSTVEQYNNIGAILQQQKKYSEAQQTYEKAVKILLDHFPSAEKILADTYHNLAGLFYSMKDYLKALNYYEKALAIDEKSSPSNRSSLAATYFNLATTYEGLKDWTKAINYAEKSIETTRLTYGNEHFEVKEIRDYLEQLQQKSQRQRQRVKL